MMKTLHLLDCVVRAIPEWVYGRKFMLGLIMALRIGAMLPKKPAFYWEVK